MKNLFFPALLVVSSTAGLSPAWSQCPNEVGEIVPTDLEPLDEFGDSLALFGDTLLVGSTSSNVGGSAYVFERSGPGWTQVAKLVPDDTDPFDRFGQSVAIWGDWAWVGAPKGSGSDSGDGAAYVFQRQPTGWTQVAKVFDTGDDDDEVGWSVAVHEDTALVGRNDAYTDEVLVYELTGGQWIETAVLTPSNPLFNGRFGRSVAVRDNLAFVGAPMRDTDEGALYVFERTATGWIETDYITGVASTPRSQLGYDIAFDGTRLAVGAIGYNQGCGGTSPGAVLTFLQTANGWTLEQEIRPAPSAGCVRDDFGSSISLDGDRMVVGNNVQSFIGAGQEIAHAFDLVGGTWTEIAAFEATDPLLFSDYATDVVLDGDIALVNEPGDGIMGARAGRVFQYYVPSFTTMFCVCSSGSPCGNSDEVGGCLNSTGQGARLRPCGTGRVSADDLTLTVRRMPANQPAILFMGGGTTQAVYGNGLLCVSGGAFGVYRFPVQDTGVDGRIAEGPGIVAFSASFGVAGMITAGQTWNFQGWYRDPGGPCGAGTNLSNGLSVTFGP